MNLLAAPRSRSRVLWPALLAALALLLPAAVLGAPKGGKPPMITAEGIVLENAFCRYVIGTNGQNRAFVNLAEKKDHCEPGLAFMAAVQGGKTWPSSHVDLAGDVATVSFGTSGVQAKVRLEVRPRYFTLEIVGVTGSPESVQLCNLRLGIREHVGTLVNAGWNDQFAACCLACNDRTNSAGASESQAHLTARAHREYGIEGAKIALFGVPTGGPDPHNRLMDAIEVVELEQGLPHPTLNGVWIKRAPERFASYLMVNGITEENVEQVVEFARGGFGCVELTWWRSTPAYEPNPQQFPSGMAGMKKVADTIHRAGMQLGLHAMQGMVGWGAKSDPFISPKADPRLLQDRHATLAAPLDEKATEIRVKEATAGWPDQGDLFLEGEIIAYTGRTETGFAGCKRGLHGTTVTAHPEGARVGHLVNCFPIWGHTVYCPDIKTDMVEQICERLATVFNEVGADMSYFDGGEEIAKQPPHWRNQGQIALGVQRRLKKPVILEGNALYTHLAWHVITRGSPHYDPIYFGRRDYTLRFKGQAPARWANNLLTGDVGWFHPHNWSPVTDAVTPDEVLLLCLKALGHKAPISFSMSAGNPWENRRMPEMLEIIRACDELKRRDYFTEAACAELTRPMAELTLEQTPDGEWNLRPMQWGPPVVVNGRMGERENGRRGDAEAAAAAPRVSETSEWAYTNPHGAQRPWLRIRARTRLAEYGAKGNLVLADPAAGVPFQAKDSVSPQLTQSLEPAAEKTPDGGPAFRYRAENAGSAPSGWCRATLAFPKQTDLTQCRRLGLWVYSEGRGGILNVQIAGTDARRDHYIPLDFQGWAFRVLDPPEDTRFWQYKWPYSFTDLMYTPYPVYHAAKEVNLYFNGLPAGATPCLVGRIEALREESVPLQSPALTAGGEHITFPVALKPDEYLEMDWAGRCRHFERNGGLLGEVKPEGSLSLAAGESRVRFSCALTEGTSPRAEVTLCVRGEPLAAARKPTGKRAAGARYPSLCVTTPEGSDARTHFLPDGKGGFRLMQGIYQRLAADAARTIPAFDGAGNAWSVENPSGAPAAAGLVIARGKPVPEADYQNSRALTLESFDDAVAYRMSETNAFEKFVLGGGKQLLKEGPARAGVTHSFTVAAAGARAGKSCATYTATNTGAAGGWCAVGRRLAEPVDLSRYPGIGLWIQGDARREVMRLQFRDTAGRHADWLVPIDFSGWRLHVFRTAEAADFDWRRVEYVLFYYNDLPAGATCALKFDDLKALPALGASPALRRPALVVNGRRIALPADLQPEESLTLDGSGRLTLWRKGKVVGKPVALRGAPLLLQPGANQVSLECDASAGAPSDVSVRVVPLR